MHRRTMSVLWAGFLVALVTGAALMALDNANAKSAYGKTTAATTLHEYVIESPHTPDQCLQTLDAISAMGPKALAKWDFGCAWGEHVGWAVVRAPDEKAALAMVPELVRDQAKVHEVGQYTVAEIRKLHEQHEQK